MITEEEFQRALTTVNAYIAQLNVQYYTKKELIGNFQKTLLINWIRANEVLKEGKEKSERSIYTRLFHGLKEIEEHYPGIYIDDLSVYELKRHRNVGPKAIKLFAELRKEQ